MRVLAFGTIALILAVGTAAGHWRWSRARTPAARLTGKLSSFLLIAVSCWSLILAILFVFTPVAGTAGSIQNTHGDAIARAAFSARGWTIAAMLLASLFFVERGVVSTYLLCKRRWTEMSVPAVACASWAIALLYLTSQPGLWFWPRA